MRSVNYTNRECLYCKKKFKIKTTYTRYKNKGLFCSLSCKAYTKGYGSKKHGMSSSKEYRSWQGMKRRTTDPKNASYNRYGARGITVCDRWFNSFDNFLEDMGLAPSPEHSIDRIDNSKGYSKENCRWATKKEQVLNRDCTKLIEINGTKRTLADWCVEYGINKKTVSSRKHQGWDIIRAITKPAKKYRRNT